MFSIRCEARTLVGLAVVGAALSTVPVPSARADAVAYLVNVTVRPGYGFADAQAALSYGYRICDSVRQQVSYAGELATVMKDFATQDNYQAAYLVNQAVNELCPELIWQLRRSAAGYTGASPADGPFG